MVRKQKASILSEDEHLWCGFIIDLDVTETLPLFRRAHITAYPTDPETVHESWLENRTVVTNNEKDFIRYSLEHSKRDSGPVCQDCWGLLIVPADAITRGRVIVKAKNGVTIAGRLVPWRVIGYANLCVTLHTDGGVSVRRLRRCAWCERNAPIEEQWYKDLPVIEGKKKDRNAKFKNFKDLHKEDG